jgi:DNA-binding IscR family transcriptional regulator
MAATRENVLAAIVEYVEKNGRRAPAKAIASMVEDKLPVVQGIMKALVTDGSIESSRGRNGGAKPVAATAAAEVASDEQSDIAAQFAALVQQLDADDEQQVAVG